MDPRAVTVCLSRAIAEVSEQEFDRLSKGMKPEEWVDCIKSALDSLDRLQTGTMPNYGDWDALFYLTWYHPGQVNLAYSMIKKMVEVRAQDRELRTSRLTLNDSGKLYIMDFGCGTMAMQYGVALAAAEALDQGEHLTSIRVDSTDASRSMTNLGEKVWARFVELVNAHRRLESLSCAIQMIESTLSPKSFKAKRPGEECWLSAMHVVYHGNLDDVSKQLALRTEKTAPNVGLITFHNNPDSQGRALKVSPFENDTSLSKLEMPMPIPLRFTGDLSLITQWRRSIRGKVMCLQNLPLYRIPNYLNRQVKWNGRDAACLAYVKDDLPW